MIIKKKREIFRGLTATFAVIMILASSGKEIADKYRIRVDDLLRTDSYSIQKETQFEKYSSDYKSFKEMKEAVQRIAVKEGEEGTVIMKNSNSVFPLAQDKSIALFGLAAYVQYPYMSSDLKAGNKDAVSLVDAFRDTGFKINSTLSTFYQKKILNEHDGTYDYIYDTSPGDMTAYHINEIPPTEFESLGIQADWKTKIEKDKTIGICVFARGAGEANTYAPESATDWTGKATGKDPLALSEDELAVINVAKETCDQVVVLINSGNTMLLKDISVGGEQEVDGIAYIGCLNDYQATGVVNVLTGKTNSTGALPDTYVADNASIPAVMNFGSGYYADYKDIASRDDPRFPQKKISNEKICSFGGEATYNGGTYIVEAEGIYVGYKYFETRYYDSIVNPDFNAKSSAGSTQAEVWDYNKEVLYDFGYGLSYLDYEQTLKSVNVDCSIDGNITAVVDITNKSDQDGYFLAQLYVQQPYTDYDRENKVEKSAVMFLNSAKKKVAAGKTEEVIITVPTKYLTSYDYTNAKTYILDNGDYYFTAAAGSHAAVNNILAEQGYTVADGMDSKATGSVAIWELETFDNTTFSVENGTAVTNIADNADLNYWTGEETVTYLSRQDWQGTYPVNYNKTEIRVTDSPKKKEWIAELRGQTYTIQKDNPAEEGKDVGLRFGKKSIQNNLLEDIENPFWDNLVSQITIDEAVGAVIHGGGQSDSLTWIENPIVKQNEGVSGFTETYTDKDTGETFRFNVHSQTLLGSSFNPQLAYEWGRIEGNTGLWLQRYQIWGVGLTQRRTPYNGRNYEYISEDPMLTNRMGYGVLQGCSDKGIINGPKHMGFNDQEHNRVGISVYLNEQKLRETDLRCFQGGLEDADGKAVMVALNRIGATCAAHHTGMLQKLLREEWAYTGIISTDMMTNKYYFSPESMIMAGVTQVADFTVNDNHINKGKYECDAVWPYICEDSVSNDAVLVERARQNLKYQLYTFANSAVFDITTERVKTWWDKALEIIYYFSKSGMLVLAVIWFAYTIIDEKEKLRRSVRD